MYPFRLTLTPPVQAKFHQLELASAINQHLGFLGRPGISARIGGRERTG